MSALILLAVALLLVSASVSRYRADRHALLGGLVLAVGGVVGTSLGLPQFSLTMPTWLLLTTAAVDLVAILACSIYAERRIRRAKV